MNTGGFVTQYIRRYSRRIKDVPKFNFTQKVISDDMLRNLLDHSQPLNINILNQIKMQCINYRCEYILSFKKADILPQFGNGRLDVCLLVYIVIVDRIFATMLQEFNNTTDKRLFTEAMVKNHVHMEFAIARIREYLYPKRHHHLDECPLKSYEERIYGLYLDQITKNIADGDYILILPELNLPYQWPNPQEHTPYEIITNEHLHFFVHYCRNHEISLRFIKAELVAAREGAMQNFIVDHLIQALDSDVIKQKYNRKNHINVFMRYDTWCYYMLFSLPSVNAKNAKYEWRRVPLDPTYQYDVFRDNALQLACIKATLHAVDKSQLSCKKLFDRLINAKLNTQELITYATHMANDTRYILGSLMSNCDTFTMTGTWRCDTAKGNGIYVNSHSKHVHRGIHPLVDQAYDTVNNLFRQLRPMKHACIPTLGIDYFKTICHCTLTFHGVNYDILLDLAQMLIVQCIATRPDITIQELSEKLQWDEETSLVIIQSIEDIIRRDGDSLSLNEEFDTEAEIKDFRAVKLFYLRASGMML